eukprot:549669-Prorocentrum_minimum.AAC.1
MTEAAAMYRGLLDVYSKGGGTALLAAAPVRIAGCVIGIVGSLILYGLLQERIMYALALFAPCSMRPKNRRILNACFPS